MTSDHANQVIESEELLHYISPALLTINYDDTKVKVGLVIGSTIAYILIIAVSYCVFSWFKFFGVSNTKFRLYMCFGVVRANFGFWSIVVGLHFIFQTTNMDRDVVWGKTATSSFAMLCTTGFFFFETVFESLSDFVFKTSSSFMIFHHISGLTITALSVYMDAGYLFTCKLLIIEAPTIPLAICYILQKADMQHSLCWKINKAIVIHLFHLRFLVECNVWYIGYQNWHHIWTKLPLPILISMTIGLALTTFIFSPYFAYRYTQILIRRIDQDQQSSQNNLQLKNGNEADKKYS